MFNILKPNRSFPPSFTDDELGIDLTNTTVVEALSEEMIRRDNYFHSCWMLLKHKSPHMFTQMAEIELEVAGYSKEVEKVDDDNEDQTAKRVL